MASHSVDTIELKSFSLGNSRSLAVHRFQPAAPHSSGENNSLRKVYIQAALHADELAGTLVSARLIELLSSPHVQLSSEIVIVPVANPIGLSQELLGYPVGRFSLSTGSNFNRSLPFVYDTIVNKLGDQLSTDVEANVAQIRRMAVEHLQQFANPESELDDLRRVLMMLSLDADVVLDLHTDDEAELHMYTCRAAWPMIQPLAELIHCKTVLFADSSASESSLPFDEAHSYLWNKLCKKYGDRLRLGAASCTVELRGCRDVSDELANQDATAIFAYLQKMGCLTIDALNVNVALPEPLMSIVPAELTATQLVKAAQCGIIVMKVELGAQVQQGDLMAVIVDPMNGQRVSVYAGTTGRVFAMTSRRMARPGTVLCKIRGDAVLADRTGYLLTAR
jgi:predicted deacylase